MIGSTMLEAAQEYAQRGIPVFPCNPANKRPLIRDGFKASSTDLSQIEEWWERWPNAMIGMPTGKASGAWVLDIDDPEVFEHGCKLDIPATRRCETGKGYHLHFAFDGATEIRNAQRHPKGPEWPLLGLPGAEIRGEGGYVILPPSRHPSGKSYRWSSEIEPAMPPDDLLKIVEVSGGHNAAKIKVPNSIPTLSQSASTGGDHPYSLAALEAECEAIRTAKKGSQEAALNEAALKIGHYVGGGVLTLETARSRLVSAGMCMPSYVARDPWTFENVSAKVERSLRDGMRQPKGVPDRTTNFAVPAHDPKTGEILDSYPEPVDLWSGHSAPQLPQALLPEPIEAFARSHAETMGVDPAGLAMAALAVCGAAISDEIELQVKRHDTTWRESARLWVALVGSPSMKKSPIISAAARPLRKIDGTLMNVYMQKRSDYDLLTPKERKNVERPKQERRIISDTTVEAAQEVLRDSPRGVLSLQDELSGFFGQMDKYAPGKGAQADRSFWLQAYNGGTYSLNRVGRGASLIPNCSMSLLGGIQPEPIRAIASDTHDDGLVQRLIPIVLRPGRVGTDSPNDGKHLAYERLIGELNVLKPGEVPLKLDQGARAVREALEVEHIELVQSLEGVSPKMAAHFGKHDGLFARLCVLWHCLEKAHGGRVPDYISEQTAERVAGFLKNFVRPNAVAFYAGLLGMSHGHDRLVQLAAWIVSQKLESVTARDVQRSGQAFRHVSADEVRSLCEKLEAFGWGTWGEPPAKSNRAPFLVNPRVHERFASHGKRELARRAKARQLIAETVGG